MKVIKDPEEAQEIAYVALEAFKELVRNWTVYAFQLIIVLLDLNFWMPWPLAKRSLVEEIPAILFYYFSLKKKIPLIRTTVIISAACFTAHAQI